jgi:hypothetical protein
LINSDGACQQLLRNKYLGNKTLTQVNRKPEDSQFLIGLMNIKDQFLSMGNFKLQDGKQIRFWEDKWLGDNTLREQYLNLYSIVRKKSATVAKNLVLNLLTYLFERVW